MVAVGTDVGAEALQFFDVPESTWVQVLGDDADAVGDRQHGDDQRLVVGGDAGVRQGGHVDAVQPAVGPHRQAVADGCDGETHVGEASEQHLHVFGAGAAQHDLAAADRDRGKVRGCLDAVGNDLVIGRMQFAGFHPVHHQRGRADPLDLGAHADEELAQIRDLGLAGRVVDDRGALGVDRCGEDVLGGSDTGKLERDVGAVQTVGAGFHHAVTQFEGGAHRLQPFEVHVDGSAAEVVATRQ